MKLFLFQIYAQIVRTDSLPKSGLDPDLLSRIFNTLFGILGGIALLGIVYGGFKYVISRGESDRIGKAKDTIMYSVIGLGITFCAFGVVSLLLRVLK